MKKFKSLLAILLLITYSTYSQVKESEVLSKNSKGNAELINFRETKIKSDKKSVNEFLKKQYNCKNEIEFKEDSESIILDNQLESKKLQQYYRNIKIEFGIQNIVSENGILKSSNGRYVEIGTINIEPKLTENEALNFALKNIGAKSYMWEDKKNEDFIKKEENNEKATYYPKAELVIIEKDLFGESPTPLLAYKFNIYASYPISRDYVYIDADNGEVLLKDPIIKHIQGSGTTRYSGQRTFETQQNGNQYKLKDYSRGNGIETYNMNNTANYAGATDFIDNDNNWSSAEYNNANKDNAALDAHWGTEKTYDYFLTKHNRNSYNNNGAILKNYVHSNLIAMGYPSNDNAFWDGQRMTYGDGTSSFDALTSIDVVGHEIGHGVCSNTANLIYSKESGAINEGLSDIWGAMIEYYADSTKQTYLIGEEIKLGGGALRSMSDPNTYGQPKTYGGTYWYDQNCTPTNLNDYCGVHRNSGVLNHWFYILSEGKTGTNDIGNAYNVVGIGKDKSAKIVYRAESVYFTATTNYLQAKDLTIQAAKDLYGVNSVESATVCQSWYAVGVGSNNCAIIPVAINGDNVICNSATNYTYTITNLVAGSTVNWSVSTNSLILVSSTNSTITVKPIDSNYNGSAIITANISGNIITKTIWIGKPAFSVIGEVIVQQPNVVRMQMQSTNNVSLIDQGVTSTTWRKFASNGTSTDCATSYGGSISTLFYLLKVTATNICGTTEMIYDEDTLPIVYTGFLTIADQNKYIIYPNPSKDIVNIDIKNQDNQPKKDVIITGELFDFTGQSVLKIKNIDNKASFSVVGLKKGTYILKIYIDTQIEFHQIVVE